MKKRVLETGILIILFCGVSAFAINTHDIRNVLKKYQYNELLPPSNIFMPGTVIYIKGKESGCVCPAEASLGSGIKLIESNTANIFQDLGNNFNLDLDANYMKLINGAINVKGVRVKSLSMQNSTLKALTDDIYMENKKNRTEGCKRAIEARIKRGYTIETIESVLISTVKYSVNYEAGASIGASVSAEIIKNLGANFGAGFKFDGKSIILGDSLIWGYKTKNIAEMLPHHKLPPKGINSNVEDYDIPINPLEFIKKPDVQ